MTSYKDQKVISIGIVSELTGLSLRKIRYYEERGLLSPGRTERGGRKYSFADVDTLMTIAERREEGVQTAEIKQELIKERKKKESVRNEMIKGQLNAHFNIRK